ncbi:hypothetical protein FHW58_002197 [Duganella sp. 1224]|uniref:hypothetical protein n=1 Tax=Duganella sp. 1224 TaxID=2587052 RepID=UPI0015C849CE|nr:hypothetical protein [Duganella sp. 1224]NYE61045.1 hypothetical protein [Duganella sp. 1224]
MVHHRIVTGVMLACAALAAQAQEVTDTTPPQNAALQRQEIARGEPARWTQGDVTTADRARTLRKEIGAALAEAKQGCQKGPASERGACMQEAQRIYQQDMAKVPQLVAAK